MEYILKKGKEAFLSKVAGRIKEFSGLFSRAVILAFLNGKNDELKEMLDEYASLREELDSELKIERDTSYYFGFC